MMMKKTDELLDELEALVRRHAPHDGIYQTTVENLRLFRESKPAEAMEPMVYEPMLIIAARGRKNINLDGSSFHYDRGQYLALFTPMAVECQIIEASEENPMLVVGIRLDRHRLSSLLLRMDTVKPSPPPKQGEQGSGIFTAPIDPKVLEATVRLLKTLDDPLESAVLGDAIIDEIYYRLLNCEHGACLRRVLGQQGQIQQISRVVEYLQENLERNVSVEELASLVNMSLSGFHKKFRDVMHLSPLQYVKLIRLNRARAFLLEGKHVSEAGYLVGYNSLAQFSREYKRQFGEPPSETWQH